MNFKVGGINNNIDKGSCPESHFDFNLPILQEHYGLYPL